MRTRPVWILPNNLEAEYPFDTGSPSDEKGLLYECRASFSPVPQTYAGSLGNGNETSKARRIHILRKDIRIRPSSVSVRQVDVSGTTTYERVVTPNAFVFIKKPTLVWNTGGSKSTEFGSVINPYIVVYFSDPGIFQDEYAFGFRYTDAPSVYYPLSTLNDFGEPLPFETTWDGEGITVPVAQGKQINFAVRDDYLGTPTWYPYPQTYYVGARMTLSVDMNASTDPADHTVVFTIEDVPSTPGFTTVDVPSWIVGPDTTKTEEGYQGFIEYSDTLAALGSTYNDYTPWENF